MWWSDHPNTPIVEPVKENDLADRICKEATALERERCIAIVEAELREQRAIHLRSPDHVKVYPRWEGRIDGLEQALKALKPKDK